MLFRRNLLRLALSFCPFAGPAFAEGLPSPANSLSALLDRACLNNACVEGYRIHFRQVSYEARRQEATFLLTLQANQSIDYPILTDSFEAQLTQTSFAAVCKIRQVVDFEGLSDGETLKPEFLTTLKSCANALAGKTERALGRDN